jgi:hypothetical protein
LLLIPNICFSTPLTVNQKEIIKQSYKISKQFGLQDIIPSIIGIESSFGLFKIGDDGKSLGISQLQFKTVKWLLKKQNIEMLDDNLRYLLTFDIEFNIIVSCSYMNYLIKKMKGDKRKAILSYNVGLTNVRKYGLKYDPNGYLKKFEKYKKIVEKVINKIN